MLAFDDLRHGDVARLVDDVAVPEPEPWRNDAVCAVRTYADWLSPGELDAVRGLAPDLAWQVARLSSTRARRRSACAWVPLDSGSHWLYRRIADTLCEANATFRFELAGFNEEPQLLHYAAGGVLDWHVDLARGPTSVRKLALVAVVDRSADCEGGEFEFAATGSGTLLHAPGTAIVFPPFLAHRVTALTRGERTSLVAWACGPAFR